jgi:hypothetical protein
VNQREVIYEEEFRATKVQLMVAPEQSSHACLKMAAPVLRTQHCLPARKVARQQQFLKEEKCRIGTDGQWVHKDSWIEVGSYWDLDIILSEKEN